MEFGPRRHRRVTVGELSVDLSIRLADSVLTVGLREPSDKAVRKENLSGDDGGYRPQLHQQYPVR
jgi:hypothetical protein